MTSPMSSEWSVARICRYPVKGLQGEDLTSVTLHRDGVPYDRVIGLSNGRIEMEPHGSWTTYKAFHALKTHAGLGPGSAVVWQKRTDGKQLPLIDRSGDGEIVVSFEGAMIGRIPIKGGVPWTGGDPGADWTRKFDDGRPVSVESRGTNFWDVESAQVSLINLASVRALSAEHGEPLAPERFRANIYFDGLKPWEEFELVGKTLRIGDALLEIFASIERCRATTFRPASRESDVNIPGLLATRFGHSYMGIYGRVIRAGECHVGTPITVDGGCHRRIIGPDVDLITETTPRIAQVESVSYPAPEVTSITLRDPFAALNTAEPGQYLRVHGAPAIKSWRNYTISGVGDATVRITVKNEPVGRFSPWLSKAAVGDQLTVSGPFGGAVLRPADTPIVVATAGIGITPALRLLQDLGERNASREVTIFHVARTLLDIPHWDEVERVAALLPRCRATLFLTGDRSREVPSTTAATSIVHRRPVGTDLDAALTAEGVDVFVCGPTQFADWLVQQARHHGLAKAQIHLDPFYSPPDGNLARREPPQPGPFTIKWDGGEAGQWTAAAGTILDYAEARGLPAASSCRSGVCGICAAPVLGTTVNIIDTFASPAPGCVLLCAAVPVGDISVTPQ